MLTDILAASVLSVASGRVAYSLTRDEIFRPLREAIWRRSPGDGNVMVRGDDGDRELPVRMMHYGDLVGGTLFRWNEGDRVVGELGWHFRPDRPPRDPGFFGQLFDCVYCMSFWTSLIACAAWLALGDAVLYPAAPLAVWAAANTYAAKGL
jgi:hypothetical protein